MQIILLKEIDTLGEIDDVVKVSDGYARNFLLPRKLAVLANPKALKAAEERRLKREKELEKKRDHFQQVADKLASLELVIQADAGEGGKLFGSITTSDIAKAASEQGSLEVSKKNIRLPKPIKTLGEHEASFKLLKGIEGKIKIKVEAAKG